MAVARALEGRPAGRQGRLSSQESLGVERSDSVGVLLAGRRRLRTFALPHSSSDPELTAAAFDLSFDFNFTFGETSSSDSEGVRGGFTLVGRPLFFLTLISSFSTTLLFRLTVAAPLLLCDLSFILAVACVLGPLFEPPPVLGFSVTAFTGDRALRAGGAGLGGVRGGRRDPPTEKR